VLAASALVVFSPVIAADAIWILVETGRPVLFAQPRVGKNGRVFRMYKFRTMVQNAVEVNKQLRTSLDELPQLINVVRGEMSLVGPRADIVEQVANYSDSDRRRLAVKPGITGWAQVNGRDSIPWPKRFELDAWYVDNWTFGLDWKIVGMTVKQLFGDRPEPVVDEMNIERAKARES
jgi:lipopolysaccharide/colanic/teichoic acid biosynthesis glycosyltransferase